ncbi:multicopper oxidase domain-containing protein [Ideonella sp. DXS22W]|uniref:Multicopper oxidase domain-containing protein n=1 Tax=Pseudaquabacterium inlustre TaxID=2984192 RepID=A0ABU9CPM6_9BURK
MRHRARNPYRPTRLALGVAAVLALAASAALARPAGTVVADVVALDQPYVYNRFGSYNPYGMVYALRSDVINIDSGLALDNGGAAVPCRVALRGDKRPRPLVLRANVGDKLEVNFTNLLCEAAPAAGADRPLTRIASMMFNGLRHDLAAPGYNGFDPRLTGMAGIEPGQSITYRLLAEREGASTLYDNGAPAGGQADGGSSVLGLYGVVNVEPTGSDSYRSQVSAPVMAEARRQAAAGRFIHYEATDPTGTLTGQAGRPLLNMVQSIGTNRWRLLSSDLNAIIQNQAVQADSYQPTNENWFREFTVVLQDELKTVQAFGAAFDHEGAGVGARDGFGINYGASGIGAIVAANRAGVGPAAQCVECAWEEFFLTSWANGDPAMVVRRDAQGKAQALFPDDPGNVHHAYLGDPVKFRTVQGGVKETHVFHLHAHQWFAQQGGATQSSYLDSQTIGPRQAQTYDIAYLGGNRNLSVGDSIFHCHMYPHFAQGMWGLWRNHDVFEDGTRTLPDGELGPGTDPRTGQARAGALSPALVPIRNRPLPPMPTYGDSGTPGYPFFVAASPGHRPPQPPMDLTADTQLGATGIGRHVVQAGQRVLGAGAAAGDMSSVITVADIQLLPEAGTPLERAAMAFHARLGVNSTTPDGAAASFALNGRPPVPGAPFADPCPANAPLRRYDVSAIEMQLVVNKAGWHDKQARINVLSSEVAQYEGLKRPAEPFFFRAHSGECIEFRHTNRLPVKLQKDDFQAKVPTDIIGQHIHLVKFDVMSSDGGANGFNYEDGTFARDAVIERVEAVRAGAGRLSRRNADGTVTDLTAQRAQVLPEPANVAYPTSIQRWWADELFDGAGKDRTLRTVFTHDHFQASNIQQHGFYAALVVEPKGSTWLKPDGTPLTGGVGAQAIITGATDSATHPEYREYLLASADFALLYKADGVTPIDPPAKPELLSAAHHNPYLVNYKNEPIPLRLAAGGEASGLYADARGDTSNVFSSEVHGDPFTPIFRAYEGDRAQFRLIHGAQEVQHSFTVHNQRWRRQVSDPKSPYVGAQELGISEHMEMDVGVLPNVTGGAKVNDYLYHYGSTDALWNGAWGLLRVYNRQDALDPVTGTLIGGTLKPLGTNLVSSLQKTLTGVLGSTGTLVGGLLGQATTTLGLNGCPSDARARQVDIEVWAARDLLPGGTLSYNDAAGIHDPTALMYVPASHVAALRAGTRRPEPLVMRANAGDCLTVRLSNRLPADQPVPDLPGDAPMPGIVSLNADQLRPSPHVGMHATLVSYDPRTSDGARVGRNPSTLVAPGQTRTMTWYLGKLNFDMLNGTFKGGEPIEFGAVPLRAMGDVVEHGAQGMVGTLVVEPAGATWWNEAGTVAGDGFGRSALIKLGSSTTASATSSLSAAGTVISAGVTATSTRNGGANSFIEHVLTVQDGLNLRLRSGAGGAGEIPQHYVGDDSYDFGERAVSYGTSPLWSRIDFAAQGAGCTAASVIADDINPCRLPPTLMLDDDARLPAGLRGRPLATPVLGAKAGDAVRLRVVQPDGRARQHSFRVAGHSYADMGIEAFVNPGASLVTVGKGITANLYNGAQRGYWLYSDGPNTMVNTGVWGLFKVD